MEATMSPVERFEAAQRERLWKDLEKFAREHIRTKDIDPVYAVLRHIERRKGHPLDAHLAHEEGRLWLTLLYVTYYNLSSALTAFEKYPTPTADFAEEDLKLPTGTERRGFRDPSKMAKHLKDLMRLHTFHGSWEAWLADGFDEDPSENWRRAQENICQAWGNGRWAGYKLAELLLKVHDWWMTPSDMGHAHSSGPRAGQALLFGELPGNDPATVAILEAQGRQVYARLREAGVPVEDLAEVETLLCDFNSMYKGGYYVGHDIDQMQEQVEKQLKPDSWAWRMILGARMEVLPRSMLGELTGRTGVDRQRNKLYATQGRIVVW